MTGMRVGDPREVAFGNNHLHSANVHLLPPFFTIGTYLHTVTLRPLKSTPNATLKENSATTLTGNFLFHSDQHQIPVGKHARRCLRVK